MMYKYKKLWAACLRDALICIATPDHPMRELDTGWILDNKFEIGSFFWICSALSLNSQKIRDLLYDHRLIPTNKGTLHGEEIFSH